VHIVVSANWLELSGNKYLRQKSVIVINVNEGDPVFGLIKDMYIVNSSLYCFECQVYNTVGFSREFASYEIEVPNFAQATETYIPLKYYLGDVCEIYKCTTDC